MFSAEVYSYLLKFVMLNMRSSIVWLFIELWHICLEYYIWLQIKRETLAARTLMSSTLCQRVWYLIISAMQQKLSFMVWHLGARMMMTTACSRCFNIFLTVIVSSYSYSTTNNKTRVDNVMLKKNYGLNIGQISLEPLAYKKISIPVSCLGYEETLKVLNNTRLILNESNALSM